MERKTKVKHFSKVAIITGTILGVLFLLINQGCKMKMIYVVEVDGLRAPVLPYSCAVCGILGGEALKTIAMSDEHGRVDFYLYGLANKPGEGKVLKVPVHDKCAKGVRNDFLKRLLLIVIVASVIIAFGIIRQYNVFFSIVTSLIVILPFLYFQFTRPVPMEFYYYNKKYVLMFKERAYAEHVGRLNESEVRVCNNPYRGTPLKTESLKK